MNQMAERLAARAEPPSSTVLQGVVEVLTHPDLVRLHPTGHHPDTPRRLEVLLDSIGDWQRGGAGRAVGADRALSHAASTWSRSRSLTEPTWLDGDTIASGHDIRGGAPRRRSRDRGREQRWLRARPTARAPRAGRPRDGLLHLRQRRDRGSSCSRPSCDIERVAIVDWDVHHGNGTEAIFRDDPSVFFVSMHQWPFYPGTGGPDDQDETTLNVPLGAGSGDDEYLHAFERRRRARGRARSSPTRCSSRPASTRTPRIRSRAMNVTEDGFRELARRSAALAPRCAAVLEGGYNLSTLPRLVSAALEGFRGD